MNNTRQYSPEPEFAEYSGGFAVTFRFKEAMGVVRKTDHHERPVLNKRQEKIMEILIGGKSLSANKIFDQLDNVANLRTVKADLATLKKLGLIEQLGSGKLTLWQLKNT
ncbi:MAG TPA: hypothetical protein VHZ76_03145 [Gammaproteobacteria bacterium]|jgi:predicted HTH transcriptional regulator|nr:hypothetical protein [Gammaproteobacteria bacterium]